GNDLVIGVRRLRIFVEVLHVGMRRRAVEIEVILFDVLAVVALAVGQAEQALLDDGVHAVPEGQSETEALLIVGSATQAVLAPVIRARAGLVVAEVVPGVATFAVVLAHRPPLTVGEIRAPFPPRGLGLTSFLEAASLFGHERPPILLRTST